MGFPTNNKKCLQHQVSLPNMRLKDMLTVMTCELLLLYAVAEHIETDNTPTCTDDLNRLTNAHE